MRPVTLSAEDLWSKHGFGAVSSLFQRHDLDHDPSLDDVPDPVWDTIADLPREQERDLIEALVRRHLLPSVEATIGKPVPIALWGSNNPIRHAEATGEAPKDWPEIDVTLDERQVVEVMRDLDLPVPEGY